MSTNWLFSRRFLFAAAGMTVVVCPVLMVAVDRKVIEWALGLDVLRGPFFQVMTALGDSLYPIILALLVLLLVRFWGDRDVAMMRWIKGRREFFKFLLINVVVSGLLVDLLKILFGRSRPKLLIASADYGFHFLQFSAARWSFPSGHSNSAMVIALTLGLFYKRWGLVALVPALLTCFSRVGLLKHYPSDVLAGVFVALLTTVLLKEKFFAD